jgi:hypothetical protein
MSQYNPYKIIREITEALEGFRNTVSQREHNDILAALKRCQELIGRLASTIVDLDVQQKHNELMLEAKLYANILSGFFEEANREPYETNFADIKSGFNPREYLKDKGVIKPLNETRVQMEEKFAADRKAKKDEIDRILSELEWKRAQQKLKREQRKLAKKTEVITLPKIEVMPVHEYVNKLRAAHGLGPVKPRKGYKRSLAEVVEPPKPKRKGGRPLGSKNKPKVGVPPKAAIGPLYPNTLKRIKAKKGSSK